jgi:hypothetical protein
MFEPFYLRSRNGADPLWLNHSIEEANHMKLGKTLFAVLLGFFLGAALYRPTPAKAAGNVYVQQVAVGVYNPIRGSAVVGFSCTGSGLSAGCYIASQ